MKKFINNILLIAGILITLILAITMLPMEQDGYLQAYNKKCQLLEDTPSPRIIFVGGSNLAFGLDSQRIKDSLNINVINYGDRKSTRLNSSHLDGSRMPSSA